MIPTNVYFLSGIRNFVLDAAHNVAGFNKQWAHRLQSVVDELANNAIEHGSQHGDEIELNFTIERQKSITLTIADHGTGPHSHTAAELTELAEAAKARNNQPTFDLRGRGFQIIGNWTDTLEFADNEHGGISATIHKHYVESSESHQQVADIVNKNSYALNI